MKKIYLDHNSSTPVRREVIEAMMPYFSEFYGNASNVHYAGQQARSAIEQSRKKVADFLGAGPKEIIFTSGGTESNNLAIKGAAYALKDKGNHIITSAIEHHSVLNTCKNLERKGFAITYLPVDEYGILDPESARNAITDKTILITVMSANNEVGAIQPIADIGRIAREKGISFHTDAVQAVGKISVDVKKLNVDFLALSGHKLYGPKGIGALYIKEGASIRPRIHGGHHEMDLRAGTENVPGIVGLGKALEIEGAVLKEEAARISKLRDHLEKGIRKNIEHVVVFGHPEKRTPNTVSASLKFVEGEAVILGLDANGIAASSGSACTTGSEDPSHVLGAMGVDAATARGSVRFSLGKDNTKEDIDHTLEVLVKIVSKLREMSPIYTKKG
ncbi:cysteine desulfurase NifS [Elusimicrobiota bacterium]